MENRQSDNAKTKQVRIDAELHYMAKTQAVNEKRSLKSLLEEGLAIVLNVDHRMIASIKNEQERQ